MQDLAHEHYTTHAHAFVLLFSLGKSLEQLSAALVYGTVSYTDLLTATGFTHRQLLVAEWGWRWGEAKPAHPLTTSW